MLDDLRRSTNEGDIDFEEEDDTFAVEDARRQTDKRFLGMTAVERMFLSIFLFLNVCVLSLALLLATGRIVF
ncbi:MAG TPA: hypothetical protein VHO69_14715 [Phototrophicaceae bacterium]|nr:hypothetical protein [Phototrophicaceae bacterium]